VLLTLEAPLPPLLDVLPPLLVDDEDRLAAAVPVDDELEHAVRGGVSARPVASMHGSHDAVR
jgi:hypothetical protein